MKIQKTGDILAEPIALPEAVSTDDSIIATYLIQYPAHISMTDFAQALAVEQSTGTWTPVPGETPEVRRQYCAKVVGVYEVPDYSWDVPTNLEERQYIVQIAFPEVNIGPQIPMLLTATIGNVSVFGKIKLVDLRLPKRYVDSFGGPKFGVPGIRQLLNVPKRPLINVMIKPCTGYTAEVGAEIFRATAFGGVDIIKDDELIADAPFNRIQQRVKLYMQAEKEKFEETGEHTLYTVNVTDDLPKVLENAHRAVEVGCNALMVNYIATGFPVMRALAEDKTLNVPILAHMDVAGVYYSSPDHGMSASLILGKLPRLAGADMVVFPYHKGKAPLTREQDLAVGRNLTFPLYDLKPVWPMPSGGIYPWLVPQVIDDFGTDVMIGTGGGVHAHPMGSTAGGKAFRAAVEATMAGLSIDEAAARSKELKVALDLWKDPFKETSVVGSTKK